MDYAAAKTKVGDVDVNYTIKITIDGNLEVTLEECPVEILFVKVVDIGNLDGHEVEMYVKNFVPGRKRVIYRNGKRTVV